MCQVILSKFSTRLQGNLFFTGQYNTKGYDMCSELVDYTRSEVQTDKFGRLLCVISFTAKGE